MDESKDQQVLPRRKFIKRIGRNIAIGVSILFISLALGMWGYSYYENMSITDAYVNAAMILAGMGPVDTLHTEGGKIFAGTYALFSGVVFLVTIAIIFAPVIHRFFHQFHLDETAK